MPTARTIFILLTCISCAVHAQIYDDYFGNGHTIGLKVSSSSDQSPDSSFHTVIGSNITPDIIGAARFLSNATLGADYEEIKRDSQIGINVWIEEQMVLPPASYLDTYKEIYSYLIAEQHACDLWDRNQFSKASGLFGFCLLSALIYSI